MAKTGANSSRTREPAQAREQEVKGVGSSLLLFCPVQALSGSGDAHPPWGGPFITEPTSAMLLSCEGILTDSQT